MRYLFHPGGYHPVHTPKYSSVFGPAAQASSHTSQCVCPGLSVSSMFLWYSPECHQYPNLEEELPHLYIQHPVQFGPPAAQQYPCLVFTGPHGAIQYLVSVCHRHLAFRSPTDHWSRLCLVVIYKVILKVIHMMKLDEVTNKCAT